MLLEASLAGLVLSVAPYGFHYSSISKRSGCSDPTSEYHWRGAATYVSRLSCWADIPSDFMLHKRQL
jgi:hypothetical protein